MKIDNNPFAKGFRETGQSRCKRKLTTNGTTVVTSTSAQHKSTNNVTMSPVQQQQSTKSSIKDDTNSIIYNDNSISDGKRKRTTSFDGSMSSLDDSGLSISESCSSSSGMSSPATTVDDTTIVRHYDDDIAAAAQHRQRSMHQHYQQEMMLQQFRENVIGPQTIGMNPAWIDLAYSYLSRSCPPQMIGYTMGQYPFLMQPSHVIEQRAAAVHMLAATESEFVQSAELPLLSPVDEQQRTTPKGKKCNFSISAILGCDS